MQIQINTDHNIENHEAVAAQVLGVVESALSRLSDRYVSAKELLRGR